MHEQLATMAPEELAAMPDKEGCELSGHSQTVTNFRKEVDRRGLSYNRCCYRGFPDICNGYLVEFDGTTFSLPAADNVELIMEGNPVERGHIEPGKLTDIWVENQKTGVDVIDAGQHKANVRGTLFSPDGRELVAPGVINERFDKFYRERAMEIGADALLVVFSRKSRLDGSSPVAATPSRYGTTCTTITRKGISYEVILVALKYQ